MLLIELIPGPRATRRASPACTRDALNCLKILLGVFPSEFSQMVPLCPDHHVSVFCCLWQSCFGVEDLLGGVMVATSQETAVASGDLKKDHGAETMVYAY